MSGHWHQLPSPGSLPKKGHWAEPGGVQASHGRGGGWRSRPAATRVLRPPQARAAPHSKAAGLPPRGSLWKSDTGAKCQIPALPRAAV